MKFEMFPLRRTGSSRKRTVRTKKRILVVEDDEALATLYRWVLRIAGFDVERAGDGWTALRLIDSTTPDLIVLDVHLPGLGGDELLEEMSARPYTRQIPVVVVTGSDLKLTVSQVRQILRKPCGPDRLVSVVERQLLFAA
jgi:DNA-binding response OmpR family regulator